MNIYIGTSGFGYKEWKGIFYPEKISPKEMLRFYSERFNAVEINNTFYHQPTESILASWAEQVPEDFIFAFKAPRVITHLKRLRDVGRDTEYFFRTVSLLGPKLGPVLFQFPKSFQVDYPLLESFLSLIRGSVPCTFEFRSPSWREDEIFDLLHKKGYSLCIADTDDNSVQEISTKDSWGYLRLRRSAYTDEELEQWKEKIASQKWNRALVFFKHPEESVGPRTAVRFQELFHSRTLDLKRKSQAAIRGERLFVQNITNRPDRQA